MIPISIDHAENAVARFREAASDVRIHASSALTPDKAVEFLVSWAHALRFFRSDSTDIDEIVRELALAARDFECVSEHPSPTNWILLATDFADAFDNANAENLPEIDIGAIRLFDELDQLALATIMGRRLGCSWAERWANELTEADDYFFENLAIFLPAAGYASGTSAAFRDDLDEDLDLFDTTARFTALEELDQQEDDPSAYSDFYRRILATRVKVPSPEIRSVTVASRKFKAYHFPRLALAAASQSYGGKWLSSLIWRSNDGRYEARTLWPSNFPSPVRLRIYSIESGESAYEFVGHKVQLGEVVGIVDDNVQCDLSIMSSAENVYLLVDDEPWLIPDND
jgi:hypothetical protein